MRNLFIEYALSFLKTPYKWGGQSPLTGIDCSGLVTECLNAFGYLKGDYSSQSLYDHFIQKKYQKGLLEGSILFFGKDERSIRHTAIALSDKLMIEAGGGDQTVIDLKTAIQKNALVRIRPINNRKDYFASFLLEGEK